MVRHLRHLQGQGGLSVSAIAPVHGIKGAHGLSRRYVRLHPYASRYRGFLYARRSA